MGLAHSDDEVLELVRRAGETAVEAESLEDPTRVEWTGGRPHQYEPLKLLP
ncbi:hypothetical protein AB0903_24725 [Streptomyces sp. NPDC048389]|uniref:hypothetical protein n=1 Tax=Streptomyces sp. NPDC048389 TaxID=3154622 RepID=UPI003451208C